MGIQSFISNLNCRKKGSMVIAIVVIGMGFNIATNLYFDNIATSLQKMHIFEQSLYNSMLHLETLEKNYMIQKNEKIYQTFLDEELFLHSKIDTLRASLNRFGMETELLNKISADVKNYTASYANMIANNAHYADILATPKYMQLQEISDRINNHFVTLDDYIRENILELESRSSTIYYLTAIIAIFLVNYSIYAVMKNIIHHISTVHDALIYTTKNKDLTLKVSVDGNDELAEIAVAFNEMLNTYRELINKIYNSTKMVYERSVQLQEYSQSTENNLLEQTKEVDGVATAMNQMSVSLVEVSRNMTETADITNLANGETNKGKVIVENTTQEIFQLETKLKDSSKIIGALADNTTSIVSIMDVIKGVAEQTNLLALNAAIEAARAGEQGRGFAVVADEVRTLAAKTQESTEEINSVISSLQQDAEKSVGAIADCIEKISVVVQNSVDSGNSFNEIAKAMQDIHERSSQIDNATKEQKSVSEQLSQSTLHIKDMADKSLEVSKLSAVSGDDLRKFAQDLEKDLLLFKIADAS